MQPRRFARVRRPTTGRAAASIFKVLNRNVVWLVLLVVFLIISSQMYLHSKMFVNQVRKQLKSHFSFLSLDNLDGSKCL
jgi:hypothetical protein